ncbi:class I SAM-dependent methyltransferase [Serratia marcescens]|jgi:2-polyprenyl-3-methyl-5-hydroxy-6-metoxy-1,4-benzoquinol methylase|uniref:class I SAM-dependent methyltransferase n=1 Tax=Serratia TaxID=613 RepID=UPI0004452322|nr:class I SAM-dependent methyltransferase [Serratia marcescens]AVN51407.1 class I SAM-dependent methyltransferase [Serratia marcescens]AWC77006.1 class I SAM-dependent methyltransferase [Serratia marcescens]EGS5468948.1 class I SAM-dependent methyltransferase [Serratia marcescens]EGT0059909.1 class I SAM-dependent methyltransferase [Serratia marcescens]EIJ6700087.1 class I SAM-dependent methyltransferase [Serratia marcescens]
MTDSPSTIPTWYRDPRAEEAMADGHAPIWRHLIGLVPENELSGVKVLDFGCNQGGFLRLLYQLRPFQQGLGVDIARRSVDEANRLKGHLPVVYQTDTRLNGWDDHFDIAFSHEVIYLIDDIAQHAADILRVLKPGGVYYAVTGCHTGNPLWPQWRERVAAETHTVVQDRSLADYARIFSAAGFQVSARRLGFSGFVPYEPDGWMPDIAATIDYYWHTKTVFRLVKP